MRRRMLLLLRHAEAEPAPPGHPDHERALTARGRSHAEEVGRRLAAAGILPDLAIASDARRAVETSALAVRQFSPAPRELIVPELYNAGARDLLHWARRYGGAAGTLLIVGHNPSIEVFANQLASQGDARAASDLRAGYPPAALALFDVQVPEWAEFGPGNAEIRRFFLAGGGG